MPDIAHTTRAQTLFLRSFRTSPTGPARENWPSPAILRKWLRKPAFKNALDSVRETLRFQADFHLANAATQAAQTLAADPELSPQDLSRLLRLSHLRQRFHATESQPEPQHDHADAADDRPAQPCPACAGRARDPHNTEDVKGFAQAAFRAGYVSPLRDWPDFPPPVPQDTFYYQLIQSPQALLAYMLRYDQEVQSDHRFQPILMNCKILLPRDEFPRFRAPGSATGPESP